MFMAGKAKQGRKDLAQICGSLQRSSANVVKEERPRRGGLVSVGRWARVVVCECHVGSVNWAKVGRAMARRLGHKGVVTIVPFAGGKGLFFVETLEEAVSLHKSRFIKIKEIMEQWEAVTEIDWRTLKLFYLSKARVRVVMKERSVLPTLIEVLDGGWDFTVSVAVARKEDGMQVREMGESTQHLAEAHTGTIGRKREEEDRSTVGKGTSAGAVGRTMEWRGGQKAENAPGRTRGTNRTTVGLQRLSVQIQKAREQVVLGQGRLPSPQSETDVGWKREVPGKGPIQVLGQEKEGKQDRFLKGPSHRATHSAKGKATVGYEDSENQRRGSAMKCSSKKLWNVLLPSSSACRQGNRSRREPLTTERSPLGSNTLPLEDASEAGTQLV
ncbi:hypothetical protein CK203_046068 [Vitis vinifera]|uniref:DUF4283 domain-containing protein n=1 Tax=Vitis vinifera TaxID=29760 RepID=A0A438HNW2_VITVI|nr:hypothetical protein CK203_046068 [Vitis vinifera]